MLMMFNGNDRSGVSGDGLLLGVSRTIREIEWLLVILVMLHMAVPGNAETNRDAMVLALLVYSGSVLFFNYVNFYRQLARWKLRVQTLLMVLFITVLVWLTGNTDSVLLNLYLLVVVVSALALDKYTPLLFVLLISASYLAVGSLADPTQLFSMITGSEFMARLAPFWLVAYITTMLAADMHDARLSVEVTSETDELTGTLNMRGFRKVAEAEHHKAVRYNRPYGLLMVDADGLKDVNDTLGHEAGNTMIRLLANTLRQGLRRTDLLARYGGDEFVLMLVETDPQRSAEVAERLRATIAESPAMINGAEVTTTVSIGMAVCPQDGRELVELMERADRAMYVSKRAGRNQVTLHRPQHPSDGEAR